MSIIKEGESISLAELAIWSGMAANEASEMAVRYKILRFLQENP